MRSDMLQLFWVLTFALIPASQGGSRCRNAVHAIPKPVNGKVLACCRYKKVKFSCYPGYKLSGGDEMVRCRGGRIYGKFPKCIPESKRTCGMAGYNPFGGRIVGGVNSAPGDWPWMAAIFLGGYFKCGGALISPTYILTAAHCFYDFFGLKVDSPRRFTSSHHGSYNEDDLNAFSDGLQERRFDVWLGRTNLKKREGNSRQLANVSKIFIHQEFAMDTYKNDIALIRLTKPVELNRFVHPICFPKPGKSYIRAGKITYVQGWGNTRKQPGHQRIGKLSQRLKHTWLPIAKENLCKSAVPKNAGYFADSMLCAGDGSGTRDACYGDSGGPLVIYEKITGKDGKTIYKWTTVGIVSWGDGCAQKNAYGYFSRLSSYISWVRSIVSNLD